MTRFRSNELSSLLKGHHYKAPGQAEDRGQMEVSASGRSYGGRVQDDA